MCPTIQKTSVNPCHGARFADWWQTSLSFWEFAGWQGEDWEMCQITEHLQWSLSIRGWSTLDFQGHWMGSWKTQVVILAEILVMWPWIPF